MSRYKITWPSGKSRVEVAPSREALKSRMFPRGSDLKKLGIQIDRVPTEPKKGSEKE